MKFTAAGDILIQKRISRGFYASSKMAKFIRRGDVRFFNLETTLNKLGECFASQFSGGTYLRAEPEVLDDVLSEFSFNLATFNNNHVMDFSYDGLIKTLDKFNETGIVHAGVGRSLCEAASPAYIKTASGTVALISLCTSFNPSMMAGDPSGAIPARPGINGIFIEQRLSLNREDAKALKEIARKTGINSGVEMSIKEGYLSAFPENEFAFGKLSCSEGERSECVCKVNQNDITRLEKSIDEAKRHSDYIILSVHTHNLEGRLKENVPHAIEQIAHRAVDIGVNAVIMHGPHLLRPIEVYRDSPIFYSLGDFFLQLYGIAAAPADFYAKYSLTPDAGIEKLLRTRSKNYTVGLMEDKRMLQTVIPYWETDDAKLTKLILMPVEIMRSDDPFTDGLPEVAKNTDFIETLAAASEPYGVKMTLRDSLVYCEW